jgi:hypothetical protein
MVLVVPPTAAAAVAGVFSLFFSGDAILMGETLCYTFLFTKAFLK